MYSVISNNIVFFNHITENLFLFKSLISFIKNFLPSSQDANTPWYFQVTWHHLFQIRKFLFSISFFRDERHVYLTHKSFQEP